MAVNVQSLSSGIRPPELDSYVVSVDEQTLEQFVNIVGRHYYSAPDRSLETEMKEWSKANFGKKKFGIGDKIFIPGKAQARAEWAKKLIEARKAFNS